MADGTGDAGTFTLELSADEVETVVQALRLLLGTLSREDAVQITEIQALLARMPTPSA